MLLRKVNNGNWCGVGGFQNIDIMHICILSNIVLTTMVFNNIIILQCHQ